MSSEEKQLPKEVYGAISALIQFLEKVETRYIEEDEDENS
jgi:type III secretion system FlhB-like substrate exporter